MPTDVIMLFDGYCKFCSGSTLFVLRRSRRSRLKFCAMQSDKGQSLLHQLGLPLTDFETFALIERDSISYKSTGIVRLTHHMRWPWPIMGKMLALVPETWRDRIYDVVAENRYRLLGRRDSCMIPDPKIRSRFIE